MPRSIELSPQARVDAIISAVLVGLLIAAEGGALSLALVWPVGSMLFGLSDAYIPIEIALCTAFGAYLGWRMAQSAYRTLITPERQDGTADEYR